MAQSQMSNQPIADQDAKYEDQIQYGGIGKEELQDKYVQSRIM